MRRIINKIILLMLITSISFVSNVTAVPLVQSVELSTHTAGGNTYLKITTTTNGDGEIYFILNKDSVKFDNSQVSGLNTKTIKNWLGVTNWNEYTTTLFISGLSYTVCVYNLVSDKDYVCESIKIPEPIPIPELVQITKPDFSNTGTYDNQAPFIKSVAISSRIPPLGKNILVTVEAEDNVAVSKVMADEITLTKDADNIWRGVLRAKEGTNKVFVIAQDENGNSATSKSISYTTMKDVPTSYNDGNRNYDKDTNEIPRVVTTYKQPINPEEPKPVNINIIENIKNKIMNFFNF